MMNDQQMINLMISEPSWEDVIVRIVADEKMDPWNIDIVKLADAFVERMKKIEDADLRVPARFILIAAILIRMKSDIFAPRRERLITIPESNEKNEELLRVLANIPPLQAPIRRAPQGNVTVNELISALKKAFEVRERREERKKSIRIAVEKAVPHAEDDITDRIGSILKQIQNAIVEIESDVEFSRLVKRWERKEIVKTLLPLLYLSQDGKVSIDQQELFKEIKIKVRKNDKA